MAEFKLGRIRFVWRGQWTIGTSYLVDDVISNGGKSYICVINHTAATSFDTDLDAIPTKWNIVADGTQWLGDWSPATYYNPGAVVKYGALIYICKTGHTSATYSPPTYLGLENDLGKWELFAEAFNWVGPWSTSTRYKINDFVVYGGTTYICKQGHVSATTASAGLETDSLKWDPFNNGVTYLGDWSGSSIRYKNNDLVKYGANLWICTVYHSSSASFDETKWDIFVEGFEFENSWSNSTIYQPGDVVTYGGYSYISKTNHTNRQPTSNPADWAVFVTGFNFRGQYDIALNYRVGDVVRNGSYTYVALLDSLGTVLSNATYWALLNSGFRWTNVPVSYTEVSTTTLTGIGSGAKFNVTRSGTVYAVTLAPGFAGANYAAADRLKIIGSTLGGISPANDITVTVSTISAGAIATFTFSGGSVTWSINTDYILGDVVTYGANSYVCIQAHTAGSINKPDADVTGSFWNLLTAGSEVNILTTTGDLVYMGANGPTRLPVGINGQVLRSEDGLPIWANYGLINNLVYVGPLGNDIPYPAAGATIDQPWKTLRYAAKQVELGYLAPNAREILSMNKQFIMKEVSAWVEYTYTFTVTASDAPTDRFTVASNTNLIANMPIKFSGTTFGGIVSGTEYYIKEKFGTTQFTISNASGGTLRQINTGSGSMTMQLSYNASKCERDVGTIVEALQHDISRGGTMKTTYAAKTYFTTAGNAYITNNFGAQTTQTIAAYNFMSDLVVDIINNQATTSYQIFNGITNGVTQQIDTTLTSEGFAAEKSSDLISIITTALDLGSVTAIPLQILPATTISVKTGTFNEILPIVVPEYTAVVGDELRSTIIQPAAAIDILANDKEKTTSALNRINAVVPALIQNSAITPTTGNTETRKYLGGYIGGSVATVQTKTNIIKDITQLGLGSEPAISLTNPTGYDSGLLNGRRLLVSNKTFLISEISNWILAQISGNIAPFVGASFTGSTRTDFETTLGYVIDALRYDITYGGNLESVIAARSFYSLGTWAGQINEVRTATAYTRLQNIISYIAEGDNSSWTISAGTVGTQDDSLPHGSADSGDFFVDRLLEIISTINSEIVPDRIEPVTAWVSTSLFDAKTAITLLKEGIQQGAIDYVNKTFPTLVYDQILCYRDVGYMVEAVAYDIMFQANFRSITAGRQYRRGITSSQLVISSQLTETVAVIDYVKSAIESIMEPKVGSLGSTLAVDRVESACNNIYDIVNSGNGTVPTISLPIPTGGTNNSFTAGFLDSRNQIRQNLTFIQDEVAAWLNVNYNAIWVGLGATGQAGCRRDTQFIIDGVVYDLTYGGNTQSLIVGSAYYSNFVSTINPTEIAATTAAYDRIKTIVGQIAQEISVTPSAGNTTPQVTTGDAGSPTAATFAQARVQDVIDWISNEAANATIAPDITWASADLQTAFAELQDKKAEIAQDVVWWVYKFHQDLNFTEDLCRRDTLLLVEAISYDVVFGSNFASIQAGKAYNRGIPSAQLVKTDQLRAELGAINFLKYKAKMIAGIGGAARVDALISDITGFINGGSVPRIQFNNPTTITSAYAAAAVLLQDNKEFIKAEIVAWLNINYPSTRYSDNEYSRDVEYILDALRYDLIYGYGVGSTSNTAVLVAGLAYYSGAVLQIDAGDKAGTLAAYARLKTVVQAVVQDNAFTPSVGNTVSQVRAVINQTVGSGATSTSLGTLVDIITTIIDNVSNAPAETNPPTSWVEAALTSVNSSVLASETAIIGDVTIYITDRFPTLVYNVATCERDLGYIIDAIRYDMMFASTYRTITAARSYFRASASLVVGEQKTATISSFRYLKTQLLSYAVQGTTAYRRIKWLMDIVINILTNGIGSTSEVFGTMTYSNDVGLSNTAEILRINREFLAAEATAWITQNYGGTVTTTTNSTDRFTTSSAHNFVVGDPVVFSGTLITGSNVVQGTTYYIVSVPTITTFTLSSTVGGTILNIAADGSGSMTVRYSFDEDLCKRDMQEYIDAMSYDLKYTGNYKSLRAAELYLNAVNGSQLSNMFYVSNATGLRNCTLNGLNGTLTEENEYGTKRPTAGSYVALNPGFGPNDQSVWVNTRSHYSQNVSLFGTGCSGAKIDGALHAGGNRSMVKNDFTTIISDGIGVWCSGANSLTELVSVFAYYSYAGYLADLGGRIRATNGNSSYGSFGTIAEGTDTYEIPVNAVLDNKSAQATITEAITDSLQQVWRLEFQNAGRDYTNADFGVSGDGINAVLIGDEFRDASIFETRVYDPDNGNDVGGTNYVNALNAAQGGDRTSVTIAATDIALSTAYIGMRIQITAGSGAGQYGNILTYNNGTKVAQLFKDSWDPITITSTTDTGDYVNITSNVNLYLNMPIYFTGTTFGNITANQLYFVKALNGTTQFTISETSGGATYNVTTGTGSMTLLAAGWDHVIPGYPIQAALDLSSSYVIEPRVSYTHPGYSSSSTAMAGSSQDHFRTAYGTERFVVIPAAAGATRYSTNGTSWSVGGTISFAPSDLVFGGGQGATASIRIGGLGGEGAVLEAIMGTTNNIGAPGVDQVVGVRVIDGGRNYTTPPTIVFTPTNGGAGAAAIATVRNGKIDKIYLDPINFEGTVNGSGYVSPPTVTAVTTRVSKITMITNGRGYTSTPAVTISSPFPTASAWTSGGTATSGIVYAYQNVSISPYRTNYYLATGSGSFSATAPTFITGTGSAANYGVDLTYVGTQATANASLTNQGVSSITIEYTGSGYTSTPTITITDTSAKFVCIQNGGTGTNYLPITSVATANWTPGGTLPASTFVGLAHGTPTVGVYVAVGGTSAAVSSTDGITWTTRTIPTLGSGTYIAVAYGAGKFIAISTVTATAISSNGTTWTTGGALPSGPSWTSVTYGNGRFVAVASNSRAVAYSYDLGLTWYNATTTGPGIPNRNWVRIKYGQGLFVAVASSSQFYATSPNGVNWTERDAGVSATWRDVTFGNPNRNPIWHMVANATTGRSIRTGAKSLGRMKAASGVIAEVRMVEPGGGYPKGNVTATTVTTNIITTSDTTNLVDSQPVIFTGLDSYGLVTENIYYIIGSTIVANTSFKVSLVAGSSTPVVLTSGTGLSGTYKASPIVTQFDPNRVESAALLARQGDGVLGNPSFSNRGSNYTTATADVLGDGNADYYQPLTFISVRNLYDIPQAGSNIVFDSIPSVWYKLVAVTNTLGDPGEYTATFQISPGLTTLEAPIDGDGITTTIKYSQVRLTGHDFLYIGTGNQAETNYPFVDPTTASIGVQTKASGGGRCFFTSTDQDGNFNVGGLFGVQQSTGTATLNADAFNLSGLQSLQLGQLNIGVGSAIITQFSTDPYFTANSDNILPTQRAIKAYITAQIGGGQSSLNVNTLTAGVVYIANDSISTTTGAQLNIKSKMNFTGGLDGAPVALGYFLTR